MADYRYWVSATNRATGEPARIDSWAIACDVRTCYECEDGRYADGSFCLVCGGSGFTEEIPDGG